MPHLLIVAALAGTLAACTTYPQEMVPPVADDSVAPALYKPPIEAEYRLEPGDTLLIQSYFDAALRQTVTVRPDGRISLILLGDIKVAGRTVSEVNALLRQRYASRLSDKPDVTVTVSDMAGLTVYVGGEVKNPAVLPIKGSLTVLQAVAQAGGFLPSANQAQVIILRRNADGTFAARQFDPTQVLRNETQELYLRRRDIVYVPKSQIAQLDQFVDQYINQIVPRAVGATFGYTVLRSVGSSATPVVTLPR